MKNHWIYKQKEKKRNSKAIVFRLSNSPFGTSSKSLNTEVNIVSTRFIGGVIMEICDPNAKEYIENKKSSGITKEGPIDLYVIWKCPMTGIEHYLETWEIKHIDWSNAIFEESIGQCNVATTYFLIYINKADLANINSKYF